MVVIYFSFPRGTRFAVGFELVCDGACEDVSPSNQVPSQSGPRPLLQAGPGTGEVMSGSERVETSLSGLRLATKFLE